jgi:3-oxoacyl-[acyl-carrier-protein] synthase II
MKGDGLIKGRDSMRRVVITGMGIVSPCGNDVETTWGNLLAGVCGIGRITRFDAAEYPSQIAGEVRDFSPEAWMDRKRVKETHTFIHYAVATARMALEAANFTPDEATKKRVGTIIGVGLGGMGLIEDTTLILAEKGPRKVSPYFIPATISNLAPGQVAMIHGFKGPSYTVTSACASGSHAIGDAFHGIRAGTMDACVAGGSESTITKLAVAGFAQMRALSKRNDEPARASRPFDRDRDGFVIAEGAAMLLLEEREAARARGARIIAEIVGYGASADAYHMTQPAPEAEGAQRAMQASLSDAGLAPEQVDYLNAHATSTGVGDVSEIQAIRGVFGLHAREGGLSVSSTKSMTGHLLGAAGALEAVIAALAIERGMIPPTTNLENPIEEAAGMDLVPNQARRRAVSVAMSNSFGFGGANATLVLKKHE